jgi:hypothetical protein
VPSRGGGVLCRSPATTLGQSARRKAKRRRGDRQRRGEGKALPQSARQRDRDVTGALSELKISPSEARLWRRGSADDR